MKILQRAENVLSSTEQSCLEQHTALCAIVWDLAAKTSGNNPLDQKDAWKNVDKRREQMGQEEDGGEGASFLFFVFCFFLPHVALLAYGK